MKAVISTPCKSVFSSQSLFVQLSLMLVWKWGLLMCVSGCSTGVGSKTPCCRLCTWHYIHYLDVNMTSLVTLCQVIKDNHLYEEKLHAHEKKTDKEWAGFEPPDEQLGTSLGMSGERSTAIPSVGEHEVQHESTDCWEFAPFLQSSSCLVQLSGDAACERSDRTGQNNTTKSEQVKKIATTKRFASQIHPRSPVTGSMPHLQIIAFFLLSITGSMDGLLNGPTGPKPRGQRGQRVPGSEPLFEMKFLVGEKRQTTKRYKKNNYEETQNDTKNIQNNYKETERLQRLTFNHKETQNQPQRDKQKPERMQNYLKETQHDHKAMLNDYKAAQDNHIQT